MKKTYLAVLLLLACYIACAQTPQDSIYTVTKGMGTVFQQNGENLNPKRLLDISASNPQAYAEMKIAKSNYDAGSVFGFAGGFLIGWPIGTALAGGDPEWVIAGIGAGLLVISIPLSAAYKKHAVNAVNIYNSGISSVSDRAVFKLGLSANGLSFKMTF